MHIKSYAWLRDCISWITWPVSHCMIIWRWHSEALWFLQCTSCLGWSYFYFWECCSFWLCFSCCYSSDFITKMNKYYSSYTIKSYRVHYVEIVLPLSKKQMHLHFPFFIHLVTYLHLLTHCLHLLIVCILPLKWTTASPNNFSSFPLYFCSALMREDIISKKKYF